MVVSSRFRAEGSVCPQISRNKSKTTEIGGLNPLTDFDHRLHAPVAIGSPIAPPLWRIAQRPNTLTGRTILFGWNAVSGGTRGWFPAVVKRPVIDANDDSLNFEIFSGARGAMGPAFDDRSVGCVGGRVDVALLTEEYGQKWVVLEDLRPPASDTCLTNFVTAAGACASDALLGDDAGFPTLIMKCGVPSAPAKAPPPLPPPGARARRALRRERRRRRSRALLHAQPCVEIKH